LPKKVKQKMLGGSNAARIAAPSTHNSRHGSASYILKTFRFFTMLLANSHLFFIKNKCLLTCQNLIYSFVKK